MFSLSSPLPSLLDLMKNRDLSSSPDDGRRLLHSRCRACVRIFLLHHPSSSPSFFHLPPCSPADGSLRLGVPLILRAPASLRRARAFASTRTFSSLFALAVSVSKVVLSFLRRLTDRTAAPNPEELSQLRSLHGNLTWASGPLFFAARRVARPSGYLNSPLTAVAAGMAKWLDITAAC